MKTFIKESITHFYMRRIESPSSISTYKQCPRKYFYQYIQKLPTSTNIHCVRGNIVHSVLENFYDQDISVLNKENYKQPMKLYLQNLLCDFWKEKDEELKSLKMDEHEEIKYFEESMMMILNWFQYFSKKIDEYDGSLQDAFTSLTPIREKQFISEKHGVRGFIDVIENTEQGIRLMDYKTSKKFDMSEAYKLQLGIYALLYHEKFNELPYQVGLYFLKNTDGVELSIEATQDLLDHAKFEIENMHLSTTSDNMADYPKKTSPLCKWRTGQCDFYDVCFKQKTLR